MVEKGFPLRSVDELREGGFTPGEVYTLILPARTLKHRRQKRQNLSPEETDRVVRLRKITTLADRVFGNHEKALDWLRRANPRLKDRAPLDILRTEVGGDLVEEMLYQIDEGIYV
jgi:putative toxin-antitoxin system antitoxin component (TIGR02293 family)